MLREGKKGLIQAGGRWHRSKGRKHHCQHGRKTADSDSTREQRRPCATGGKGGGSAEEQGCREGERDKERAGGAVDVAEKKAPNSGNASRPRRGHE